MAMHLARVFSLYSRTFIKPHCRTLYSAASLGLNGYFERKAFLENQFKDTGDIFRSKMKEQIASDTSLIFTEDLKNMLHLMRKDDPEDIKILLDMLKKFNTQNQQLRFGTFVFGPVIMRSFYFLEKPDEALEVLMNPEFESLFDQFSSYLILMDSFFKQKKYGRVLEVFNRLQERQLYGTKYPKDCVVLALAACYRINSEESFNTAVKILEGAKENGSTIIRRGISIAAALAIKKDKPAYCLEILSLLHQTNYFTVRNLKLMALADLDRLDDVFVILNSLMEIDYPENRATKRDLFNETFERIKAAVERLGSKERVAELMRIEKALRDADKFSEESLDLVMFTEITPRIEPLNQDRRTPYRRDNLFRHDPRMRSRKGIYDQQDA